MDVAVPTTLGVPYRAANGEFSPWDEPVLHREQRRGSARRDADLPVGVLHVVVGRLDRDAESACDLLRLEPPCE